MNDIVSIVIPVYNIAPYIDVCLRLCLCQTYPHLEIVCVDDGSTDGSREILDQLAHEDSRIRVIHGEHKGVVAAREAGVQAATGDWLLFCDGDDMLVSDAVERLVKRQQETGSRLVIGDYYFFEDGIKSQLTIPYDFEQVDRDDAIRRLLTVTIGWMAGKLIHKEILSHVSVPYDIKIGEDFLMMIQMVTFANGMARELEPLYLYRQRADSAVHQASQETFRSLDKAFAEVRRFLKEQGLLSRFETEMAVADFHLLGNYLSSAKWVGRYRTQRSVRKDINAILRQPWRVIVSCWKTLQPHQWWVIPIAWFSQRLAVELYAQRILLPGRFKRLKKRLEKALSGAK